LITDIDLTWSAQQAETSADAARPFFEHVRPDQPQLRSSYTCPPGTNSNDCGLFPKMPLVNSPSAYLLDIGVGYANAFTGSADCARSATVTCTEFAIGSKAKFPGGSTTTYKAEDIIT
jgi:hypothetical protein